MIDILSMKKDKLASLKSGSIERSLTSDEVLHIFVELGYAWFYDYEAAKAGKKGLHAKLKSGNCSDGFINAKGCLAEYPNVRGLFARQIALMIQGKPMIEPDYIVGVPSAATELGNEVADMVGAKKIDLAKDENGNIKLASSINEGAVILVIDDICTKGTGFSEAVREIRGQSKDVFILPFDIVIVNRGGKESIIVDQAYEYKVISVADRRINDWSPEECPLCKDRSEPIKPKESDENWERITTSQAA